MHLYTAPPPGATLKQIADLLAAWLSTAMLDTPSPVVVKVEDLHGDEFIPGGSLRVVAGRRDVFLFMVHVFLFCSE